MNATTIVIHDPDLLAKLAAADGRIVFQGPAGEPVKTVETVSTTKFPPGFKIPFTKEELDERSKDRTGRPLGDVIKEFEEKYGE
jgi:hypothetical protein